MLDIIAMWVGYILIMSIGVALIICILSISVYCFWHLVIHKSYLIFNDWKRSREFCFDNMEQFAKWTKGKSETKQKQELK